MKKVMVIIIIATFVCVFVCMTSEVEAKETKNARSRSSVYKPENKELAGLPSDPRGYTWVEFLTKKLKGETVNPKKSVRMYKPYTPKSDLDRQAIEVAKKDFPLGCIVTNVVKSKYAPDGYAVTIYGINSEGEHFMIENAALSVDEMGRLPKISVEDSGSTGIFNDPLLDEGGYILEKYRGTDFGRSLEDFGESFR